MKQGAAALLLAAALALPRPGEAADAATEAAIRHLICHMVDAAAAAHHLPTAYLTRVLWQESRFRSNAKSPAGAEGVAQFMPQTAAERGLADPTDPEQAIAQAARFLAELTARFGNLGLAAAGYNAGPARVARWLQGQSELPTETRLYVRAVTGRPVEEWRAAPGGAVEADGQSCLPVILELARTAPMRLTSVVRAPAWQVRLDSTLARAVGLLTEMQQRQSIAAAPMAGSPPSAESLCASIRVLGASCDVYRR